MVHNNTYLKTIPNTNPEKRVGYLEWDEFFMAITFLELQRSTRTGTKNAAIVLNHRQIVISTASNNETKLDTDESKPYVYHAVHRAIKKCNGGVQVYMTTFPCFKCAEAIIQAGISEIIYYRDSSNSEDVKKFLRNGRVIHRQFVSDKTKVEIDFKKFNDNYHKRS